MTDNAQSKQGGARVRVPPPLVFAAAVVLGAFVPGLRLQAALAARIPLGVAFLAGGMVLGFGALAWFRKTGQHPRPSLPSPELILQGPYRFTRNPMYVSMTLLTLGIGTLSGRLWIAALAPAALLAVHFLAVLPEERYLAQKFGEPYLRYQSRVRRYL